MSTKKGKSRKSFAEVVKRYSPLKKQVVVENEDEDYQQVNKILPKIWLGNYDAAKNKEFFQMRLIFLLIQRFWDGK
jgi:hypothetical protein